jgi:hypothetical protein
VGKEGVNMVTPEHANVAVIGCGYWGKNLVRNFAQQRYYAEVFSGESEVSCKISSRCGMWRRLESR